MEKWAQHRADDDADNDNVAQWGSYAIEWLAKSDPSSKPPGSLPMLRESSGVSQETRVGLQDLPRERNAKYALKKLGLLA